MSSWEETFRKMKEKPAFCGNLTRDIEDDDVKNEKYCECMLNPLKYVERKYKDEIYTFGRTDNPNLDELLECKKTENIINLNAHFLNILTRSTCHFLRIYHYNKSQEL